jgi:hypothetical protein
MNKLTPEQALADIKAVRRDRTDSHWLDCAIALADELTIQARDAQIHAELGRRDYKAMRTLADALGIPSERVMIGAKAEETPIETFVFLALPIVANLRAELDALNAEPAAPEPPALARFLPRLPAEVSAPPDGWVYVGMGFEPPYGTRASEDISVWLEWCAEWNVGQAGRDPGKHYAIRWTAPADIWHRFGLLAPSEGGGWIPHTPGDAMPCEGRCEVLLKGEMDDAQFRNHLGEVRFGNDWYWDDWYWDADDDDNNIIGWRPAVEVAQ